MKWDPILGSVILTVAVPDPQSWMALLRKEIGHFHEKKELSLDTRYSEGCGGWASGLLGLLPVPEDLAIKAFVVVLGKLH